MGSEWRELAIDDVCVRVTSGGTPSRSRPEYFIGGDWPWVKTQELRDGWISETQEYITDQAIANSSAKPLPAGTVLVAMYGATVGQLGMLAREMTCNQACCALIVDEARADPRFVYYQLLATRPQLISLANGAAQQNLSGEIVKRFRLRFPPLREQRRIADILSALDDKIELNRRMSQTLESMARALFKSWFVDFDPVRAKAEGREPCVPTRIADLFPDSFDETEFGQIPSGWEIDSIENIAERVAMGPFGSSIKVDTFVPGGIPVISGQHLRGVLLDDSDFNFVTIEHADKLSRSNVQRGDVVFTHAGSIGQAAYIPESARYDRYIVSQRQFYMRCDTARVSPLYVVSYFQSPEGRRRLLANTSSTGVPSISQPVSYLKQLRLALPPQPLMNAFDAVARSLYSRTAAHTRQSHELADVRNELLPRLLTGSSGILERHFAEAISGESQGGSVSTLEGRAL